MSAAALLLAGMGVLLGGGAHTRRPAWRPQEEAAVRGGNDRPAGTRSDGSHAEPAPGEYGGSPRIRWVAGPAATRLAAVLVLGLAVALVAGGVAGVALGMTTAVVTDRAVRRMEPAGSRRRRESREAELPLTLDLLSVCLQAGMPLVAALEAVATALPGPFSDDLRVVAGLQRLGAAPTAAWAQLAGDRDLAPVARAVARSAASGSRLAAALDRLAADRRSVLAAAGLARARTAGVVAMAPLGLCFLPAFVCLGIAPIVLSLATEVLP